MAGTKLTTLTIFSKIIVFLLTTSVVNSEHSPPCTDDCPPFIPGAVAYWPMTAKTKGSDLSGNNNHATFVGLTYRYGPSNETQGAVHFNGSSNSYAKVTNSPSMQVGKYPGFSFSGYVRYLGIQNKSASLIDWSSFHRFGVYIAAASEQIIHLRLYPNHDADKHRAEFPNNKLMNGVWHFVGVSYNKATGRATMFKDGELEVKQLDRNIAAGTEKTKEVGIGKDLSTKDYNHVYKGDMSCIMLFKFALTAEDFEKLWSFCRMNSTRLPNITVSDISSTRAIASWTQSPGTFSGYKITIERKQSELDQETVHPPFIPASHPKSVVLTNLVPGATYRVRVWHMQGDIKGRARSSAWFDTKPSLVVESDSITFSEISATSANVSWKDVTGNYDNYTVDVSPTTGGAKADPSTLPKGTTTTSLINLSPRTVYSITIKTKVGSRTKSHTSKSLTWPAPPTFPTIAVIGLTLILIFILLVPVAIIWYRCKPRHYSDDLSCWYKCNCLRRNKGKNNQNSTKMRLLHSKKRTATNRGSRFAILIANDLKKRYRRDYKTISFLPYRNDRVIDITQLRRNFEMKNSYEYIDTPEDIFNIIVHSNHESNRYVLEALTGYGKSSVMKKLAYMWATDNGNEGHFKFLFLINTDDFIKFQKENQNPIGLSDFVSSDYFVSDQSIGSGHNRDEIWRLVETYEKHILFIIDNNCKSEGLPDDLTKLFLRNTMQDSTVIITCTINQVPTVIPDHCNQYTSIRIKKHEPTSIETHICEYSDIQGKEEMGNVLVQKLGIKNKDDKAMQDDVKLSWITSPFMLLIIVNMWQDIWEFSDKDEMRRFSLDEPYIYPKVVKNIFKYYECWEEGSSSRGNHAGEGNTYDQETLTLGRLAWDMIEKNNSSIQAKELGPLKDGEANVLRDIGVLGQIMIPEDGILKETYSFTDEIWKFYFAARFLRNELDQGKKEDKDIQNAVEMVRNLNKNIEGLFKKFIDLSKTNCV